MAKLSIKTGIIKKQPREQKRQSDVPHTVQVPIPDKKDDAALLYLRAKEKTAKIKRIISSIEAGSDEVTSDDLKCLKNSPETSSVRLDLLEGKMWTLIEKAMKKTLFPGDQTMPSFIDLAYYSIREFAYRSLDFQSDDEVENMVGAALESALNN